MNDRVVFLDRDGVICQNRDDYVKSVAEFVWMPGAKRAIRTLGEHGYRVVVVTNQAAVGHGIITHAELNRIHRYMMSGIRGEGGAIHKIYCCPHRPEEKCDCRKPKGGLLRRAAEELDIDLTHSFLVGDSLSDIEAGHLWGCVTILVKTGRGSNALQTMDQPQIRPDYVVEDLAAAVRVILELKSGKKKCPALAQPAVGF